MLSIKKTVYKIVDKKMVLSLKSNYSFKVIKQITNLNFSKNRLSKPNSCFFYKNNYLHKN